jgi:hypothetical protein
MPYYTVHPVFDSDHTIEVAATSCIDAACKYLTFRPVNKAIMVSETSGNFHVIEINDVIAAYPDIKQLLEQSSSVGQETITEEEKQATVNKLRNTGKRKIVIGSLWLGGGLTVTTASMVAAFNSSEGGLFCVATGAIIYGIYKIVEGISDIWSVSQ